VAEKKKVCSRRKTIVAENNRRLKEMHPRTPKIDEKTLTIEGLIPICEEPLYVVEHWDQRARDDVTYLCARCKVDVGGSLESQGAKITRLK